eukprot:Gb_28533 [translate_table: standard]
MRRTVGSCRTKSSDGQLKRGLWTEEEDMLLIKYIEANGVIRWSTLPKKAGLMRSGKSCRLRWMNYLRPEIKRGHISPDEEELIIRLHNLLGNRWALIAGRVPGRTDNDIKNYWNIHLSKKLAVKGIESTTHESVIIDQSIKRQSISDQHHDHNDNRELVKINDSIDDGSIIVPGNLNSRPQLMNSPKEFKQADYDIYSKALVSDSSAELNFISNSTVMTWRPSLECSMASDSTFNYRPNFSDNKGTCNSADENVSIGDIMNIATSTNSHTKSDELKETAEFVQTIGSELQQNRPYNICENMEDSCSYSMLSPYDCLMDSFPWQLNSSEMELFFSHGNIDVMKEYLCL